MKTRFTFCAICIAALAGQAWAGPEHIEGGTDAGSLPGVAQQTTGSGTVGRITGQLVGLAQFTEGGDFEDMYVIFIKDPTTFTATTITECDGVTTFDSRLYLFDINGIGLLANDNTASPPGTCMPGGFSFGSTLLNTATDGSGAALSQPGLYLLAITVSPRSPFSNNGSIFDLKSGTEISGPDGPGGGRAIVEWLPPIGACCISGKFGPECSIGTQTDCEYLKGNYLGDDTTCEDAPCDTGACCHSEGACTVATPADCNEQLNGDFQGPGTNCNEPDPCAEPIGACCVSSGCLETTPTDCSSMGGKYLGDGITCKGDPCSGFFGPPGPEPLSGQYSIVLTGVSFASLPTGGCCLPDGSCELRTQTDCSAQSGDYHGDYSICPDPAGPDACPVKYALDIRYGKCPNKVKANGGGKLKVHIVGDVNSDIHLIDLDTIQLRLCGGTNSILPYKPPRVKDRATPLLTSCGNCNCHKLKKDYIDDVDMKFKIPELMNLIGPVPNGQLVDIEAYGSLLDGTPFSAHDCVLIDRPGSEEGQDGD